MSSNLFVHFECWTGIVTNEKLRNSYWITWKAKFGIFGMHVILDFSQIWLRRWMNW